MKAKRFPASNYVRRLFVAEKRSIKSRRRARRARSESRVVASSDVPSNLKIAPIQSVLLLGISRFVKNLLLAQRHSYAL